jgi:small subunit ribosomal protein S1
MESKLQCVNTSAMGAMDLPPRRDATQLEGKSLPRMTGGQEGSSRTDQRNTQGHVRGSVCGPAAEDDWNEALQLLASEGVWEGRVTGTSQDGLSVRLGRLNAFVPVSQLWVQSWDFSAPLRERCLKTYLGIKLPFRVIEANRDNNRLVLSERLARQKICRQAMERLLKELVEGDVVQGVVSRLRDFGAFINLGGTEGLIHISELSWRWVRHPREVVQLGEVIRAYVLKLDHKERQIGLSLKRLQPNPWELVGESISEGQLVTGVVSDVVRFGAFVALDGLGVNGLVHANEMAVPPPRHPRKVVKRGDKLLLRVLRVDTLRQRIGLSLTQVKERERKAWKRDHAALVSVLGLGRRPGSGAQ